VRPPRRASAGERLLLAVTWVSFAVAFAAPFLQIDDWRLRNDAFSLLGLSGALWTASPPAGLIVATCVVAVPLCELAALTVSAVAAPRRALRAAALRRRLARWSMLEVFVLALAIFLVEGRAFVRTELRAGTLLLSVALALHLCARGALEARLRRRPPAAPPEDQGTVASGP
jgi:uncharacterized paraquat-inducible protein A